MTPEPRRIGALVRDCEGDLWRRGRTRWSCLARARRWSVLGVGRLRWDDLLALYGPVEIVDRKEPE